MNNIEITSKVTLDDIIWGLQGQLETKELVDFCVSLGDSLTDDENFYKRLKKRVDKICNQYNR